MSDFWNVRLFYFYKQIYSGMRSYCHHQWKIGYTFEMKRRIKIRRHGFVGVRSDNILSEFQPIWSRGCRPGTRNARTTRLFFTFEKQRKNKIRRHPSVMRLSHQGRHRRGINFLYNNRTVTVNMEQVQISATARGKLFTSE